MCDLKRSLHKHTSSDVRTKKNEFFFYIKKNMWNLVKNISSSGTEKQNKCNIDVNGMYTGAKSPLSIIMMISQIFWLIKYLCSYQNTFVFNQLIHGLRRLSSSYKPHKQFSC